MERLGEENFVRRNRLNIVASSIAALSVAAAAVAVEKPRAFDPLSSSADAASHLVLKTPHKAYQQLIDNLPKTEKAEATLLNRTFNFTNNSGFPQDHMYINFRESKVAHFVSGDLKNCSSVSGEYADDQWNCSGPIIASTPCTVDPNVCIAVETFAYESCQGVLEADQFWGERPTSAPQVSAEQVSTNDVCSGGSVGGVAEAPDLSQLNENLDTKNKNNTLPIAAGVAFGAIGIAGTALYINRPRKSK